MYQYFSKIKKMTTIFGKHGCDYDRPICLSVAISN